MSLKSKGEAILDAVRKEHPQYAEKLKGLKVETSAKMTSSAAKCSFDTATRKPRCIRISSVIFGNSANLAHLDGIVRHELAHAIAGLDARHGAAWKDVCSRIGGVTSTSHSLDGLEIASPRRRVEKAESKSKPQAISSKSRVIEKRSRGAGAGSSSLPSAAQDLISQLIRF